MTLSNKEIFHPRTQSAERAIDPTSFPLPHLSSNSICLFFVLIYRNELVILIRNSFKEEIYMFGQSQQHSVHEESGKQQMTIFRPILRVVSLLALILIIAVGFVTLLSNHPGEVSANAGTRKPNSVVGVWFVNAVGAPFQPHLATFHSDGTMLIDNPEAGDPHTSDSAGMGPWQIDHHGNGNVIHGKFEEINADRTTHKFVSTLIVTFTITVHGDTFTGPAKATYFNPDGTIQAGPFPATLNGTRITLS